MGVFSLIPFIVLIPFVGVLLNALFGRRLMPTPDSKAPGVLASVISGLAFTIAVLMFVGLLGNHEGAEVPFLTWVDIELMGRELFIPWTFKVDTLSSVMMLVVTGVGTLIHIYAIGYMDFDINVKAHEWGISVEKAIELKRRRFPRFFTYLNLFLGSMLILVTGNNFLMMFVGWELVGLCSFLLIGFWYDDPHIGLKNAGAASKAFIVNRVGDFGMLMAIFLIFATFGSLQFTEVFARAECMVGHTQAECLALRGEELEHYLAPHEEEGEEEHEEESGLVAVLASTVLSPITAEEGPDTSTEVTIGPATMTLGVAVTAITLFLLLGATGKSAQLPLFVWLPDAMAGPTPVSALIHAATMVTAGIYMITRANVLYHLAPFSASTVAWIGAITALVAALTAIRQYDIKKVLAYSTVSQLGFMIAAVGLGGYIAGIFHLITHAFFKALLFKGSGSVIQGMERGMVGTLDNMYAHGHDHHEDDHHGHDHDDHDDHHHDHVDPQDMRNMGGLLKQMPITGWTYLIGAIALAGIWPFAGFWSKDEILLDAQLHNLPIYIILSIAAFLTAFYMTRQVLMVFFGAPRTDASKHAMESPRTMTIPLMVLAVLSLTGGFINLPGFFPILPKGMLHGLGHWLEYSVLYAHVIDPSLTVAIISTVVALAAIGLGYVLYNGAYKTAEDDDPLAMLPGILVRPGVLLDELYMSTIVPAFNSLGHFFADTLDWELWHDWFHDKIIGETFRGAAEMFSDGDRGIVDGVVNGVAKLIGASTGARRMQTGYVRNYALVIGFGVVAVLIFVVLMFLA